MKGIEIAAEIERILPSFRDDLFDYVDSKFEWFSQSLVEKIFVHSDLDFQTENHKFPLGLYVPFMAFGSYNSYDWEASRHIESMIKQFVKKYNSDTTIYAKQMIYGYSSFGWSNRINDWATIAALFGIDKNINIEIACYIKIKGLWYRVTLSRTKTDIRHVTVSRGFLNS